MSNKEWKHNNIDIIFSNHPIRMNPISSTDILYSFLTLAISWVFDITFSLLQPLALFCFILLFFYFSKATTPYFFKNICPMCHFYVLYWDVVRYVLTVSCRFTAMSTQQYIYIILLNIYLYMWEVFMPQPKAPKKSLKNGW